MKKKNIVYFAHPMNSYRDEIEVIYLNKISEIFEDFTILNPSDLQYQTELKIYREKNPETYMEYFRSLVLSCDSLVYLPFRDNKISSGVSYEIESFRRVSDKVFRIDPENFTIYKSSPDYESIKTISLYQTRRRLTGEY